MFGRVTSVTSTGTGNSAQDSVRHMERDLYIPGNILYITKHSLWTINLESSTPELIVGSDSGKRPGDPSYQEGQGAEAMFDGLTGFLQWNSTAVIVADSNNDCVRLVDRVTRRTSRLSGTCDSNIRGVLNAIQGVFSDSFDEAKFHKPYKIVRDPTNINRCYVTQREDDEISVMDFNSSTVEVLNFADRLHNPKDLVFEPGNGDKAYLSQSNQLINVDFNLMTIDIITSYSNGSTFIDGPLPQAFHDPEELVLLNEKTLIVASDQKLLRVIDLSTNDTSSICKRDGDSVDRPGTLDRCTLNKPMSLLYMPEQSRLLIGTKEGIMQLEVMGKLQMIKIARIVYCVYVSIVLVDLF